MPYITSGKIWGHAIIARVIVAQNHSKNGQITPKNEAVIFPESKYKIFPSHFKQEVIEDCSLFQALHTFYFFSLHPLNLHEATPYPLSPRQEATRLLGERPILYLENVIQLISHPH